MCGTAFASKRSLANGLFQGRSGISILASKRRLADSCPWAISRRDDLFCPPRRPEYTLPRHASLPPCLYPRSTAIHYHLHLSPHAPLPLRSLSALLCPEASRGGPAGEPRLVQIRNWRLQIAGQKSLFVPWRTPPGGRKVAAGHGGCPREGKSSSGVEIHPEAGKATF